jgi:hypothetical protein
MAVTYAKEKPFVISAQNSLHNSVGYRLGKVISRAVMSGY